jgi:hypothetical protein
VREKNGDRHVRVESSREKPRTGKKAKLDLYVNCHVESSREKRDMGKNGENSIFLHWLFI